MSILRKTNILFDVKITGHLRTSLEMYLFGRYGDKMRKIYNREHLLKFVDLDKFEQVKGVGLKSYTELKRLFKLETARQKRLSSDRREITEVRLSLIPDTGLSDWERTLNNHHYADDLPSFYRLKYKKGRTVLLEDIKRRKIDSIKPIRGEKTKYPQRKTKNHQLIRCKINKIAGRDFIQIGFDQIMPLDSIQIAKR